MKEKTIVSATTVIASLVTYFYAKQTGKDAVPYVMVGVFFGALIGEAIAKAVSKDNDNDNTPNLKPA
jgi:uncharacterized membrane protein YfcA